MNAADAIFAGFADIYIPKNEWPDLIKKLEKTGDCSIFKNIQKMLGLKPTIAIINNFLKVAFASKTLSKL